MSSGRNTSKGAGQKAHTHLALDPYDIHAINFADRYFAILDLYFRLKMCLIHLLYTVYNETIMPHYLTVIRVLYMYIVLYTVHGYK